MELTLSKYSRSQIWIGILIIWYIVGITSLVINIHPNFILLTPLNLLLSIGIVWYNHPKWSKNLTGVLVLCYFAGFFVEVLGTQTGLLFGEYTYGRTLGPKIAGTPLFMGINWAMLIYLVAAWCNHYTPKAGIWVKALLGASLMTVLDFFIEPVAINLDFWTWHGGGINSFFVAPLQNYIVWWAVAFLLLLIFHKFVKPFRNSVAEALLYIQFIFFILMILIVI